MDPNIKRQDAAQKRRWRVRKKVAGTAERPRLTVFRSHLNIYAQIINDDTGVTLVSASTRDKDIRDQVPNKKGTNKAAAAFIGTKLAEKAKAKGVTKVCFDRGPYKYHGRIAALADAARKAGLDF